MQFECDGVRYEAPDLVQYQTGHEEIPRVFATRDYTAVFVVTADPWRGTRVHRADAVEVKALAARFGLDGLRRSLR